MPCDLDPTTAASDKVADAIGDSIQTGTPDIPQVDDDLHVQAMVNGISSAERALETKEPLRQAEDLLDARSDVLHMLLASIAVRAEWLAAKALDASIDDRYDAGHIVRLCRIGTAENLADIITYAAGIKNRCVQLPYIVSACNSNITKADAAQRMLEVKP